MAVAVCKLQAVTSEAGYNHFRERFQVTTLRPVSTGEAHKH